MKYTKSMNEQTWQPASTVLPQELPIVGHSKLVNVSNGLIIKLGVFHHSFNYWIIYDIDFITNIPFEVKYWTYIPELPKT